jgi:membrane protein YqaA with SNARE-associated domain
MFSVLGGTIAFSLGLAIGGENVIAFFDKIHLGDKTAQALDIYKKYDFWAVAIAALTPVPYMLFSWLGGMAKISIIKFIIVSIIFRTMRFGGESLLFYFFGAKARIFIEKYFNLASVIVIILLLIVAYLIKLLGDIFTV